MSEYSPAAIRSLYDQIAAVYTSAQFAGIIGDSGHTYGYHRGGNYVGSGDYSMDYPQDYNGDGEAACALDITCANSGEHYALSQALLNTVGNPAMGAIREFYGSVDGWNVCGWDFTGGYPVSSDDSHLWHVHISVHRIYANDQGAMSNVAAAITGGSGGGAPTPPPSGGSPHAGRPWPSYMPQDQWFGDINGSESSHGGYYANERPDIQAIQDQLLFKGYVPGLGYPNSWADGLFEQPTIDAVAAFQRAEMPGTQYYGQCWSDDWQQLMR